MAPASRKPIPDDDELLLNTYKYRGVRYECEAALQAFEKAEEWADLIKYLQRLQKIFQRSPEPLIVPHKVLVAKRLCQCLHAALPAGVHLKTLETYQLIFEKVGRERLAKDVGFYSEGLFPLCRHASYEVKPFLLSLIEAHYLPLGRALAPCLSGLVLCLLTALGDGASESHERVLALLDATRAATSTAEMMGALWTCLLLNSHVRMQALAYAHARFPPDRPAHAARPVAPTSHQPAEPLAETLSQLAERRDGAASVEPTALAPAPAAADAAADAAAPPAAAADAAPPAPPAPPTASMADFLPAELRDTLIVRALRAALADGDTLVVRTTLELLLAHLPLRSMAAVVFGAGALRGLVVSALHVLAQREWALTRRVYHWLTGMRPEAASDAPARGALDARTPRLRPPAIETLVCDALREIFSDAHLAAAAAAASVRAELERDALGDALDAARGAMPPPADGSSRRDDRFASVGAGEAGGAAGSGGGGADAAGGGAAGVPTVRAIGRAASLSSAAALTADTPPPAAGPLRVLCAALEEGAIAEAVRADTALVALALAWAVRWRLGVAEAGPLLEHLGDEALWTALEALVRALCDADVGVLSRARAPEERATGGAPAGPHAVALLGAGHVPRAPTRADEQVALIDGVLALVGAPCAPRATRQLPTLAVAVSRSVVVRAARHGALGVARRGLALIESLARAHQQLTLVTVDEQRADAARRTAGAAAAGDGGGASAAAAAATSGGQAAEPSVAERALMATGDVRVAGADEGGAGAPDARHAPAGAWPAGAPPWPAPLVDAVEAAYCALAEGLQASGRAPSSAELSAFVAASELLAPAVLQLPLGAPRAPATEREPFAPMPGGALVQSLLQQVSWSATSSEPFAPMPASSPAADERGARWLHSPPGAFEAGAPGASAGAAYAGAAAVGTDLFPIDVTRSAHAVASRMPALRWPAVDRERDCRGERGGGGGGGGGGGSGDGGGGGGGLGRARPADICVTPGGHERGASATRGAGGAITPGAISPLDDGGLGGLARWCRGRWASSASIAGAELCAGAGAGAGAAGAGEPTSPSSTRSSVSQIVSAALAAPSDSAQSARGGAVGPGGDARDELPRWLRTLLRGCNGGTFELVCVSVDSLAHLYGSARARDAQLGAARMPPRATLGGTAQNDGGTAQNDGGAAENENDGGSRLPELPRGAVLSAFACVWGFLGAARADVRLAAAGLWQRLQVVWPADAAAVLERAMRADERAPPRNADDALLDAADAAPDGDADARADALGARGALARAANLTRFGLLWQVHAIDVGADARLLARGDARGSAVGQALFHALDCLDDESPAVRAGALAFLADALRAPARLTEPLLLLAQRARSRPRQALYALAKLAQLFGAGGRQMGGALADTSVSVTLADSMASARAELGVIAAAAAAGCRAGLRDDRYAPAPYGLSVADACRSHVEMAAATCLLLLGTVGPAPAVPAEPAPPVTPAAPAPRAGAHASAPGDAAGGVRTPPAPPPPPPPPPLAAADLPSSAELAVAAAELLLAVLRATPQHLAAPLAAACTRPLLRALCGALAAAPRCEGVLPPLLLVLLRCVRAHVPTHELPAAFVPCLAAGLRAHGSAAWVYWHALAIGVLPFAGESLAPVVLAILSALCELPQSAALPAPQLALVLHGLHDVAAFCVHGRLPPRPDGGAHAGGVSAGALSLLAAGGDLGYGSWARARSPSAAPPLLGALLPHDGDVPMTPSSSGGGGGGGGVLAAFSAGAPGGGATGGAAGSGVGAGAAAAAAAPAASAAQLQLARTVLFQQAPVLLHALLHVHLGRQGALQPFDAPAPPLAPGALRALALRPLALLAQHCPRDFAAAAIFVWEGSSAQHGGVGNALLSAMNELPRAQPRELLATVADALVGVPSRRAAAASATGGGGGGSIATSAAAAAGSGSGGGGGGGLLSAPQIRVPETVALRFVLAYVSAVEPAAQLHGAWPQLITLVKAALAGGGLGVGGPTAGAHVGIVPALPALLLAILHAALARLASLAPDGVVDLRARDVREACELVEQLLHAGLADLRAPSVAQRAAKSLGAAVGGTSTMTAAAEAEAEAALFAVGKTLLAVSAPDRGAARGASALEWAACMADPCALLLCLLCSKLLPLLHMLHGHRLAKRADGVADVVAEIVPLVLLPLEQPSPPHGAARMRPRMALRLLCALIEDKSTVRAWRKPVSRLFGASRFFEMSGGMLQLWARVINALSSLETPKGAVAALLSGRDAEALSLFAGKQAEATSAALLLKRLSFLLYAGERDQYVGALQGLIFEKLVSSLKYSSTYAHVVQAEVLFCVRVLAIRVSPRHLHALWPIALAELKRIFAQPDEILPSLVLAAFLLLDTLLTFLPDEFGFSAWMFVVPAAPAGAQPSDAAGAQPRTPAPARADSIDEDSASSPERRCERASSAPHSPSPARRATGGADSRALAPPAAARADARATPAGAEATFEPYLARLVALGARGGDDGGASGDGRGRAPAMLPYATAPSADGRRRPLLALAHIKDVAELAPYALALDAHLHHNDIASRGTQPDGEFVDELLGCHFVSPSAAERRLAGLRDPSLLCESANGIVRIDSLYAQNFQSQNVNIQPPQPHGQSHVHDDSEARSGAADRGASAPACVGPALAEALLLPLSLR